MKIQTYINLVFINSIQILMKIYKVNQTTLEELAYMLNLPYCTFLDPLKMYKRDIKI